MKNKLQACYNLIFQNGVWDEACSDKLPDTISFDVVDKQYQIGVKEEALFDKPLHFIFENNQKKEIQFQINLNASSSLDLIETHVSDQGCDTRCEIKSEIMLASSALLRHTRVLLLGEQSTLISEIEVSQEEKSQYQSHDFFLKGLENQTQLFVNLNARQARCDLSGLYYAKRKEVIKNNITVKHYSKDTVSKTNYKGILDQAATGFFQGNIYVGVDASGVDAALKNKNILLSREASMHTTPQLEIFSDDIRCTHGATVGQLDEQALFYLQSRGLTFMQARQLLLMAFTQDRTALLSFEPMKQKIESFFSEQVYV